MIKTKETANKETKKDKKATGEYVTKYRTMPNGAEVDNPPEL